MRKPREGSEGLGRSFAKRNKNARSKFLIRHRTFMEPHNKGKQIIDKVLGSIWRLDATTCGHLIDS